MLSRKYLLLVLICLFYSPLLAQKGEIGQVEPYSVEQKYECETIEISEEEFMQLPWYGNNEILETYRQISDYKLQLNGRDSTAQTRDFPACVSDVESIWLIPVKFWFYFAEESDPNIPTDLQLQNMMDELNRLFQNSDTGMRFFMHCPEYVIEPDAVEMNNWQSFWNQFGNNNTSSFSINVHVVGDINGENGRGVYNPVGDFIGVERSIYQLTEIGAVSTLAHEIGHYMGLAHTHRNWDKKKCRQESVSRTRTYNFGQFFSCLKSGTICDRSADGLCDTPADPNLGRNGLISNCNYIEDLTDRWGDLYNPDERNIMSYSGWRCRTRFSQDQSNVMLGNIIRPSGSRTNFEIFDYQFLDSDKFEPDDSDEVDIPRLISFGEEQCHSFHNIFGCQDEVDWLRISDDNGFIMPIRVEVNQIELDFDLFGNEYPVEELVFWNTDGNQIKTTVAAATRSQSGTTDIYELDCQNVSNDILIEVVRKPNVEQGLYSISLNATDELIKIIADDQLCENGIVSLSNVPENSSVTWSADNNNFTLENVNEASTGIQSFNPNSVLPYILTAEIENNGCILTLSHTFSEVGSTGFTGNVDIEMDVTGAPCEPSFGFTIPRIPGATEYIWNCSSDDPNFLGCTTSLQGNSTFTHLYLEENQEVNIYVTVTAISDCGPLVFSEGDFYHIVTGDCNMRSPEFGVRVTPNPTTSGNILVEIEDEESSMDYRIIISSIYSEIEFDSNVSQFTNQVDITNFADGLYYLHVISGEKVVSEMFIIQNQN